jgi:predicted RNA-binding Zn ribbon-like protein
MEETTSSAPAYAFELSGGALCLDFANTCGDRARPEQEHLHTYGDVAAFVRQAEVVDADQARELADRAAEDPTAAAEAFTVAVALRDAIYRIFSALAAGDAPSAADLDHLNSLLPDALAGLRVEPRGAAFAWSRDDLADSLTAPLRPIVRSAAELLISDRLDRIRECDGATCTWLFLDQSRNRSRRWCSMETCGNRAKVRRHYRRQRGSQ